MATYYIITLDCGCTLTSSFPLSIGSGRWCNTCKKFVYVTNCESATTMQL